MKPISELVNDKESCEKIWDCIFSIASYPQEITHIFIDVADNGKKMVKIKGDINGFEAVIKLYFDGGIFVYVEMPSVGPRPITINPFQLVKLLMDLGYAPEEYNCELPTNLKTNVNDSVYILISRYNNSHAYIIKNEKELEDWKSDGSIEKGDKLYKSFFIEQF